MIKKMLWSETQQNSKVTIRFPFCSLQKNMYHTLKSKVWVATNVGLIKQANAWYQQLIAINNGIEEPLVTQIHYTIQMLICGGGYVKARIFF